MQCGFKDRGSLDHTPLVEPFAALLFKLIVYSEILCRGGQNCFTSNRRCQALARQVLLQLVLMIELEASYRSRLDYGG